ncbi:FtsH protease activity modulator HflK [Methylomagnum ishizawai]|uniref:FtsH protease activity modulator HflK n=1 Tax=Methylomagnum ishizawai TaxID=1760988 RepID=UPI001C34323A|nr:FtsH protease activity modulator HflK [Methylomagnum ishizawai]BBL76089.1 protease modulator HflK [Methylomagnum ishizawai]
MSWNEPGGNKKDPWSGRDQQETPPDLDEVMRGLQDKIGKIFGGGTPGGGGDSAPLRTVGMIAAIGLGAWTLFGGIYSVDEGSRAVVTRFGRYVDTTLPGLHWHIPAPIEKVDVVNMEQQRFLEIGYRSGGRQQSLASVPKEALMLTEDENIIDIRLAVQYQIKDAQAYLFNVSDPDATLKQVIESAQRAVIGKNTMDFVLTEGRGRVADDIKTEIQQTLDQYQTGIRVTNVSLVDAQPPEEVQSAFEDAIKAREDEQRLKNEAEAYANEVVPKARGAAARLLEESEAYKQRAIARAEGESARFRQLLAEYEKAPEVTRERMYLDAMQEIFEQTGTVLVDMKGSNNIMYLPLDKLQRPPASTAVAREAESQPATVQTAPDSGFRGLRATTSRGREGRGQ